MKRPRSALLAAFLLTTLLFPGSSSHAADWTLSQVEANGLTFRVAEQGEGPLVLLLHGFPESWYSWRHQLPALAAAGYRAVAPDMRGYGGTDAPAEVEAYDVFDLCADVRGLIEVLGEEKAILVGHDWGAALAWGCVHLEPRRFHALVALSVPGGRRWPAPPTTLLRQRYGDNFFYMLYFQEEGVAEAELDPDPSGLLRRFMTSPDTPLEPPTITDPKASAGGLLGRLGMPKELPPWLSQEDLDYYVAEFERTGFRGGLNYYRAFDRSWEMAPEIGTTSIEIPVLFVAGDRDLVIAGRDQASLEGAISRVTTDLRGVHLLPDAGHWIQQERAEEVNELLIDFLASVDIGASERVPSGQQNPQAPPETAQFAFMVGEWDCTTRFIKPDGSGYNEGRAKWTGYFTLDGWAIKDDWISYGPNGQEFHGTNIRSFNPQTRKWDNRWLSAGNLQWKYFEAEKKGDTMVMTGGDGRDARGEFVDRNVFYNITADSWSWRKDRSHDGGETWFEGVGFIEAKRVR